MREFVAVSAIAQGSLVLFSYLLYFPTENIWAGLNDPCMFYIWCVSGTLSTVAFLVLTLALIFWIPDATWVYAVAVFFYSLFLTSSSLYMPFAVSGWRSSTMLSLFVTAVSSCCLLYCAVIMLGLHWVTVMVGFLAFHCVVVDFIFWGFTWTYDIRI